MGINFNHSRISSWWIKRVMLIALPGCARCPCAHRRHCRVATHFAAAVWCGRLTAASCAQRVTIKPWATKRCRRSTTFSTTYAPVRPALNKSPTVPYVWRRCVRPRHSSVATHSVRVACTDWPAIRLYSVPQYIRRLNILIKVLRSNISIYLNFVNIFTGDVCPFCRQVTTIDSVGLATNVCQCGCA
jgi:hypothetical protein